MNHISATNLSFFSQIVGIFKIGEGIDSQGCSVLKRLANSGQV
jgi:hypothetical protein